MEYSEVETLARERAQARADKDFARADELRAAIDAAGWKVIDTPGGFELVEKPPFAVLGSLGEVDIRIDAPITMTVIVDGWPDDVDVCLSALLQHAPIDATILAIDCGNVDGAGLRVDAWEKASPERVRAVHLEATLPQLGWASVVRAAIEMTDGPVFAVLDMSTVLEGDAVTPMVQALAQEGVVASGWRGVNVDVDDAWRTFTDAGPGEVDAVLGYLMVVRTKAAREVGPDVKARFYRNADMEWCLLLREAGGRIVVPSGELPLRQDRHHGYHDCEPSYRDKQSKKTYDRILQRFRGRTDILAPR